MTSCSFVYKTG